MTSAASAPKTSVHAPARRAPPQYKSIVKEIPGADFQVSFAFSKSADGKVQTHATIVYKTNKKEILNVPIEPFLGDSFDHISLKSALTILQKNAIDYVRGKIIFLSLNISDLVEEWKKNKTANNPDAKENKQAYLNRLKICGKLINKSLVKVKRPNKTVIDAYHSFGSEYYCCSKYREALAIFQRMFSSAKEANDREGIRLAHRGLGLAYQALGESTRAESHHKEELNLLNHVSGAEKGEALLSIGNIYLSRGKNKLALNYFKQFKATVKKNTGGVNVELSIAYSSKGMAYLEIGKTDQAEKNYQKSLKIRESASALSGLGSVFKDQGFPERAIEYYHRALKLNSVRSDEGAIYGDLGLAYQTLGEFSRAREYFEKDLAIAEETDNCEAQARALYNLACLCMALEEDDEGAEYIPRIVLLLKHLNDSELIGMIYGLLGHLYFVLDDKEKSIDYHQRHLQIATENENGEGILIALSNLGRTYLFSNRLDEAFTHLEKAIAIAKESEFREFEAGLYSDLGCVYHYAGNDEAAIEYYELSIKLYADLHKKNCKENLQRQIALFDTQFRPYRLLEESLIRRDAADRDKMAALLVADSSRSKSLKTLIEKKLSPSNRVDHSLSAVKVAAHRLQTTFVIYSCDPFNETRAWCWVISPVGSVDFRPFTRTDASFEPTSTTPNQRDLLQEGSEPIPIRGAGVQASIIQWVEETEQEACRGPGDSTSSTYDPEQLKEWYRDFILPIEDLIPQNGERAAFIPDAFLHGAPFALFLNDKGEHLFQNCTPIIAPSIETLLCIEKLNQENLRSRSRDSMCTITCSLPHERHNLEKLVGVDEEKNLVHAYFKQAFELDPEAENMKNMAGFGHLHVASHGLSAEQKNIHSVFTGALALATPELLYSENIVDLSLNAHLAFLSACSSGHGKGFREGSIGLPFAYLAGGVASVIATLWSISDATTPKIVEKFYEHYLGQTEEAQAALTAGKPFGQAEALREAMLFAKRTFPDKPHIWGAFFVTGLPGDIRDKGVFAELGETTRLDPGTRIWVDGDTVLLFSLKEGKMTTTQVFKDGTRKEFAEDRVTASLKSFAERRSGIPQKTGELNHWVPEEKEELLRALLARKIEVTGDRVIIKAIPRK